MLEFIFDCLHTESLNRRTRAEKITYLRTFNNCRVFNRSGSFIISYYNTLCQYSSLTQGFPAWLNRLKITCQKFEPPDTCKKLSCSKVSRLSKLFLSYNDNLITLTLSIFLVPTLLPLTPFISVVIHLKLVRELLFKVILAT